MRSYVLDENIISDQPRFVKSGRSGGLHKKVVQITAVYAIIEWVYAGENDSLFSLQLIMEFALGAQMPIRALLSLSTVHYQLSTKSCSRIGIKNRFTVTV